MTRRSGLHGSISGLQSVSGLESSLSLDRESIKSSESSSQSSEAAGGRGARRERRERERGDARRCGVPRYSSAAACLAGLSPPSRTVS